MLNKSTGINRLEKIDNDYQLIIIGGGIYGATLCWEATHRGVKTLLIERDDYACGASSNSLKTIHGGLRSLQSLNLASVLKGIRERSIFLRIAANYVKPLPCILPTTTSLMKSKPIVGMGLLLYNALSQIKIFSSYHSKQIPNARLLSRKKFISLAPNINTEGVTGGALWHDAQIKNTERLVWQFIKTAITQGATAINHTTAVEHKYDNFNERHEVLLRDQITGHQKTVTASAIVDVSAAWNFIQQQLPKSQHDEDLTFLKSVNIIVRKNIFETAVGANIKIDDKDNSRLYFFAPWRDCTIIGTWYSSVKTYPEYSFSQREAEACLAEINAAFNHKILNIDDICNVHIGFLPATNDKDNNHTTLDKNLLSDYQLKDWSEYTGMQNIYSLRGTKYTLARHDAKHVFDYLTKKLKWQSTTSRSHYLPIYQAMTTPGHNHGLSIEVTDNLLENYGADTEQILEYIKKHPQSAELIPGTHHHIQAEIQHVVLYEQALTLSDLLKRRLAIGDRAPPSRETAKYCARVMQQLLSWTEDIVYAQVSDLYASYPDFLVHGNPVSTQPKAC